MRIFYVYIMASRSRVLYTGFTSDLSKRVQQHKLGTVPGFSSKYKTKSLVYYESYSDVHMAIGRETQIKSWRRSKKIALVCGVNPEWNDLEIPLSQVHHVRT